MDAGQVVRALLAAGSLVAGSVCIGASYIVAAVITSTLYFGHPDQAFQQHLERATLPLIMGGVFYLFAVIFGLSALLRRNQHE